MGKHGTRNVELSAKAIDLYVTSLVFMFTKSLGTTASNSQPESSKMVTS